MGEYIKVNVAEYVAEGLRSGKLIPIQAEKFARINARQGVLGEIVISWSVDSEGKEVQEKVDTVKADKKTNQPGWVVTKVNEEGVIIIDQNNHPNQWIIEDSEFHEKYEMDPEKPNIFRPKNGTQIFVQIPDDIILSQWGQEMKIARGGYINITKQDNLYGISERDFNDTYRIIGEKAKKRIRA